MTTPTTQELVELLHEAIESGMSVCYDDTFAAAAYRLTELQDEVVRMREALLMIRQHYTNEPNALAGMVARAALDPQPPAKEQGKPSRD